MSIVPVAVIYGARTIRRPTDRFPQNDAHSLLISREIDYWFSLSVLEDR